MFYLSHLGKQNPLVFSAERRYLKWSGQFSVQLYVTKLYPKQPIAIDHQTRLKSVVEPD